MPEQQRLALAFVVRDLEIALAELRSTLVSEDLSEQHAIAAELDRAADKLRQL